MIRYMQHPMDIVSAAIAIITPFLYIFLLTGTFVYLFRKKHNFQTVLPLALISTTLFVFLFTALFHTISIAVWLTTAAALSFIPLLVLDKERARTLKELIFTPGFVIFCIIYLFAVLFGWSKVVPLLSDSSMHWAPHVWTMWLRDDFYTSPGVSLVIHGDYPPAIQLFELIWSKVAGVYHEGLLFVAIQVLSFSMLFPVFGSFTWHKQHKLKDWLIILLVTATLLSLPLIFFVSGFYASLDVDTILAFIFAYGVYLAITESRKFTLTGLAKLSLAITFLVLTKQIAIVLAGIVVLIYLLSLCLSYREHIRIKTLSTKTIGYFRQWKKHWKTLAITALLILLPLAFIKLWSAQTTDFVTPGGGVAIFHLNPVDTLQIPDILDHDAGSQAQQYFSRGFIKHMFFDSAGFLLNNVSSVSYMQVVLLFVGAMLLIWSIFQDRNDRNRVVIVATIITVGWFMYCFVVYSVFLFGGMNDIELSNLDTPNRYLRTYLFAMLLIAVILLIKKLMDDYAANVHSRSVLYFTAVIIVFFSIFFNKDAFNTLGLQSTSAHKIEFASLNISQTKTNLTKISEISGGTFEAPARILVAAQSDKERHYLQYSALPNRIALLLFDKQPTQNSVCNKLQHNDYFVVGYDYPDEESWATVKACLTGDADLTRGSIYKITTKDDKTSLSKLP